MKIRKELLYILGIVIIGSVICFIVKNTNNPKRTARSNTPTSSIVDSEDMLLSSVDSNWQKLTNTRDGYSLHIPRLVEIGINEDTTSKVPLRINDSGFGVVDITPLYRYEPATNLINGQLNAGEKAVKLLNDPSYIGSLSSNGQTLKIEVAPASNQAELEDIIRRDYGPKCVILERKVVESGNHTDLIIGHADQKTLTEPDMDCYVNYVYAAKYSEKLKKVMTVNLGQDCYLRTGHENSDACATEAMMRSFQFEQ